MAYGKIDPKIEYAGRRMTEAVDFCVTAAIAPLAEEIHKLRQEIEQLKRERVTPGTSACTEKETAAHSG